MGTAPALVRSLCHIQIVANSSRVLDWSETNQPNCEQGPELTCIASQLQQDILALLLHFPATTTCNDSLTTAILAFSHCMIVDISRIFCTPTWLSLDCPLPIMAHRMSYDQATHALQYAEQCVHRTRLEVVFFVFCIPSGWKWGARWIEAGSWALLGG